MGSKRKSGDEPALQATHREFRESCKGGQVKADRNMQKIVPRFQKREGIRSKVKLGKREKRRKQESSSQDPDEKVISWPEFDIVIFFFFFYFTFSLSGE